MAQKIRKLAGLFALVTAGALPLLARGDRVVPQMADGAGVIRTKLDISNLSTAVTITRMKVFFYRKDGTPWILATNLGTASEFLIEIGRGQVLRIETLGASGGIVSGYAVVRNLEGNAQESSDYQISVSVFYEVYSGSRVVDTVAVPVGPPTLRWSFPVEIDVVRNLYSGIAVVNLSNEPTAVNLQLWSSFSPSSADASDGGRLSFTLRPGEQRAQFLNEPDLFASLPTFKGQLVGNSEKPVSVVALLQAQTANGVQYSTLTAACLDALHTESQVYVAEGGHLDADEPHVAFINTDDGRSFDAYYQTISSTVRYFVPENGALLAPVGFRTTTEFANLTRQDLLALSFYAFPVDVTDVSGNLAPGFTFALRTSLGRLAKARIHQVVASGTKKELALQVYVYR